MIPACRSCGSILDSPREDPVTRRFSRKCSQCLRWQELSAEDVLVERLRHRARTRGRYVA